MIWMVCEIDPARAARDFFMRIRVFWASKPEKFLGSVGVPWEGVSSLSPRRAEALSASLNMKFS